MYKRQYFISGKVQGVNFRIFTEQVAKSLELKGFVKNLLDGRVEIVISFDTEEQIKQFERHIKNGNGFSKIERIEKIILNKKYPFHFESFEIHY